MLRYYPPWIGPQQVVCKATGHTVGIQKDPEAPIIFIHVDDLKICPPPSRPAWTPAPSKARSLCASMVAFRPGSHITDSDSSPSVDVSTWNNSNTPPSSSDIHLKLDQPIDLTGHILSPFCAREFNYQDSISFSRTPYVLSICSAPWIENICYCCLYVGQTFDSVPLLPLPDIRLAVTVSFSAARYLQSPVFNGHGS